jgi:D-aspartate ligase
MNKSDYNDNLIIQELIPGDDTAMRVMNCYSDNNGIVRLMCLGRPVLEEYTPLALGNYAAILTDIDKTDESRNRIFGQIKNFLESIKYTGFSNFDMKYDAKSGEYKLLDFNPRQGRSSFFVSAAGYNSAEFLTDNAVYNKTKDTVYADSDMLWLSIPKSVLLKYVENAEVIERVKRLIKEKKYKYTLLYKKDMNPKRFLRIKLFYNKHKKDYKTYFFRKNI